MPNISDYLPLIRAQFFIKNLFLCNFITWSRKEGRFVPIFWNNVKYTLPLGIITVQVATVLARMRSLISNGPKNTFLTHIISCCLSLSNVGHWLMGVACKKKSAEITAYFNGILVTHGKINSGRGTKLCLRDVIDTAKRTLGDVAHGESGRFALCIGLFTQITPTILLYLLVVVWPCAMPHLLRSSFPDCVVNGNAFVWDFGVSEDFKWAVTFIDMFSAGYGMCVACVAVSFVFQCGVTCIADHLKRHGLILIGR